MGETAPHHRARTHHASFHELYHRQAQLEQKGISLSVPQASLLKTI
jgi:hypothetical protein